MVVGHLEMPVPAFFLKSVGKASESCIFFKYRDLVAKFPELVGGGKTGKPTADNGNLHEEIVAWIIIFSTS